MRQSLQLKISCAFLSCGFDTSSAVLSSKPKQTHDPPKAVQSFHKHTGQLRNTHSRCMPLISRMANECKQQGTGNNRGACKEECDDLIIHNPLSKYLNNNNSSPSPIINSTQSLLFDIHQAIHALQTKGYHHIPSIFTNDECHTVMNQLWEFVQDVSGGCVHRTDPMSWYSSEEISLFDCNGNKLQSKCNQEEAE